MQRIIGISVTTFTNKNTFLRKRRAHIHMLYAFQTTICNCVFLAVAENGSIFRRIFAQKILSSNLTLKKLTKRRIGVLIDVTDHFCPRLLEKKVPSMNQEMENRMRRRLLVVDRRENRSGEFVSKWVRSRKIPLQRWMQGLLRCRIEWG